MPRERSGLARTADRIAGRCGWHWEIGHELAKEFTSGNRTMTPTEMALAQGLQIALDRSTTSSNHLRSWWLDALTPLEEQPTDWHNTWASVVDAAEDPAIVAHLCDLLWLARHGPSPHLYARRAINAYLTMPPAGCCEMGL